jgi:hypothetical protein
MRNEWVAAFVVKEEVKVVVAEAVAAMGESSVLLVLPFGAELGRLLRRVMMEVVVVVVPKVPLEGLREL